MYPGLYGCSKGGNRDEKNDLIYFDTCECDAARRQFPIPQGTDYPLVVMYGWSCAIIYLWFSYSQKGSLTFGIANL
jgi:hypothetical protein